MLDEFMNPTKAELIRLMKRRGAVTVAEATAALDLSASSLRQHFNSLRADGFVTERLHREGVGRPSKKYSLTPTADFFFRVREHTLLQDLMDFLVQAGHHEAIQSAFQQICLQVIEDWEARQERDPSAPPLPLIEEHLNDWGYLPEIIPLEDGTIQIDLRNSPFPRIDKIQGFPCFCEKALLERLAGGTAIQSLCIKDDGCHRCRFLVTAPALHPGLPADS